MRFPTGDDMAAMLGHRVVVRHRLASKDGPTATDVIGILDHVGDDGLVVRRDDDRTVEIDPAAVVAARVIPIRAVPRRQVRDLQAAAQLGWQATETARLGGWLLRAAHGFTGRGNSVLPLASPDVPIADAVEAVQRWYGARGLRPAFQVIEPLGADVTDVLDRLGWPPADNRTLVMTAPLDGLASRSPAAQVRINARPDDAWLAAYHYRGGALPPVARAIVAGTGSTGPVTLGFASIRADAEADTEAGLEAGFGAAGGSPGRSPVAAIGRGAVSVSPAGRVWLGVTAVEVDVAFRRRGMGTAVMTALADWARQHGATDCYVQVADENTEAHQLYGALGLAGHHHYHYRRGDTAKP